MMPQPDRSTNRESDAPRERLTDLGHLGSAVGHHVINAFSAIVSNAELLRLPPRACPPADAAQIADVIVKTALDASAVARKLIDFTRPVTAIGGQLIALDGVARSVIEAVSAEHEQVSFVDELRPVPEIAGDEFQIREMLRLLIANAVEALPRGGGTVTLATMLDERGWVALEVRDDGAGMAAEVQERALEPFFTTKPGRLGVGLSIANGIWRRHRGTMSVRSKPGEGTCARLCAEPTARA